MNEQELPQHWEALANGRAAAAELEVTRKAFQSIRANAVESIIALDPSEGDKLNRLVATCNVIDVLFKHLDQIVERGEAADEMIKLITQRNK